VFKRAKPLEVLWLLNGLFESSEISAYLGQWLFGPLGNGDA